MKEYLCEQRLDENHSERARLAIIFKPPVAADAPTPNAATPIWNCIS